MLKITLTFETEKPKSCAECPLYDNNSRSIMLCHGDGFDKIPDNCPAKFEYTND